MLPAGSPALKRSAVGVLFLTVFIDLLGFGIVLPLLPRYGADVTTTGLELALLMSAFSAMQFIFSPIWGRLSDRVGRRPILMLGLFGSTLSYTLFGLAPESYAVLLTSRIAAGIFGATISTAQAYIADVTGHHDRGKQMAVIGAAFGLGFTLGPVLGGFSARWGLGAPGFIAAGFSGIAFLCAWRVLPEPEGRTKRPDARLQSGLRFALSAKPVLLVLLLQVGATFCFAAFESTLALLTEQRWGYDIGENGLVYMMVGFCMLIAQGFIVRRFMPRVGETRFAVGGAVAMAVGLGGLAAGGRLALLPIAVVGYAMISTALATLLSRLTPPEMQGEVLGIGQAGLSAARIFGPFVAMLLFVRVAPETPYWLCTGIMAASFGLAMLLRPPPAADQ